MSWRELLFLFSGCLIVEGCRFDERAILSGYGLLSLFETSHIKDHIVFAYYVRTFFCFTMSFGTKINKNERCCFCVFQVLSLTAVLYREKLKSSDVHFCGLTREHLLQIFFPDTESHAGKNLIKFPIRAAGSNCSYSYLILTSY